MKYHRQVANRLKAWGSMDPAMQIVTHSSVGTQNDILALASYLSNLDWISNPVRSPTTFRVSATRMPCSIRIDPLQRADGKTVRQAKRTGTIAPDRADRACGSVGG
jgi:hypothetical protein